MSKKMRKWEEEYEKWTNGEYDSMYEVLENKYGREPVSKEEAEKKFATTQSYEDNIQKRTEKAQITKKEYSKYKNMKAIKNNISKVKNIVEYRNDLISKKGTIDSELKRRQEIRNLNKERIDIEKENADLLLEIEEINSKLKSDNLSKEDRKKYENDKKINIEKRNKNNERFVENQEKLQSNISRDNKDIVKLSDKELKEEEMSISTKISKCNMACNILMQGKSWKDVELKLDNWENYKGKRVQDNKLKNGERQGQEQEGQEQEGQEQEGQEQEGQEQEGQEQEGQEQEGQEQEGQEQKGQEQNSLVKYKSFKERHPILAKIPFLAKIADKLNKTKKEEIDRDEGSGEIDRDEGSGEKNNEFKKYLKEIAYKGMDGIKNEKMEKAREKLEKNKEKAYRAQDVRDQEGIAKFSEKQPEGSKMKQKSQNYSQRSRDER